MRALPSRPILSRTARLCLGFSRLCLGFWCVAPALPRACAGDEPTPAPPSVDDAESHAGTPEVRELMRSFHSNEVMTARTPALSPKESLKSFKVRPGLTVDLVASEPDVVQPVYMSFDSRGWLWVTQYIQFQFPAGLKIMSYDEWLLAVFDKTPEPPPKGAKGADRVALFKPDGKGGYKKVRDAITGLNIATAALKGAGGIWVMNPPYLLFYPDANDDDIPDGDPKVCLSGFGLQDTHSVANSLQWGPDGWLYGANGSTTGGVVSSRVTKNVRVQGQHIWRYNPKTEVFEIFAEGGGNTFSCEIDAQGRVFSGTNGVFRGVHYDQGMSGEKNFGKHGMADNPYAFGYFPQIETKGDGKRFSQAFCIYDGDLMAQEFGGRFIAANALRNLVYVSERVPDTSTFKAVDEPLLLKTSDTWFRPVDLKVGPDGAIWVADWYDARLGYGYPVDSWSKTDGRIFRIRPTGASMEAKPFDLHVMPAAELVKLLGHPNKWFRRQAALELSWRNETETLPELRRLALDGNNPHAFDALCALQMLGGLTDDLAVELMRHPDPYVRRWVVRCIGDTDEASEPVAEALASLAAREEHPEVRTQLLASAKRFPAATALPIVKVMMARESDLADKRLPLMTWWVLESKAETDRAALLALFADPGVWRSALARDFGAHNLAERWAMAGGRENYEACAKLLALAPGTEGRSAVVAGMAAAFEGGRLPALPPVLSTALDDYLRSQMDADLALAVAAGNREAVAKALAIARDGGAPNLKRAEMVQALAGAGEKEVVPVMLDLFKKRGNPRLKEAVLPAAAKFDDPNLAETVLDNYVVGFAVDNRLKGAADRMLASRQAWARLFMEQVELRPGGETGEGLNHETKNIEPDVLRQLELYDDPYIKRVIAAQWPSAGAKPTNAEHLAEIARIRKVLVQPGDPARGREIFTQRCSVCHTLFGEGGNIGPELTGYQRDNLDFWLTAIVEPSLEIREGFALYSAQLKNGQTLVGMMVKQDGGGLVLKNVAGQLESAKADQILSLDASPISLMPEGLLTGLSDPDLRALFAYLMKP